MHPVLFFIILAVLISVAAFSQRKSVRISSAILAFAWACLMFVAARWLESLNQNAWYSSAASEMLEACIVGIEQGREEVVLGEMKKMSDELEVTYRKQGNFKELAEQMTENLNIEPVVDSNSEMKTEVFKITYTLEKFTRILWQRSYPEEYNELIVRYKAKDPFEGTTEISEDELTPGHFGLLGWDQALIPRAFEQLGHPLTHGAKADYNAEQNRLTITHSTEAQDAFRQRFPEFEPEKVEE